MTSQFEFAMPILELGVRGKTCDVLNKSNKKTRSRLMLKDYGMIASGKISIGKHQVYWQKSRI